MIDIPKISIIMPVYNVERYLHLSIESLLNQTLKEIEIICINDCSSDSSGNLLKKFKKKDKRIKIIENKKNLGPGGSRNVALKEAKGKYILFVDSDDSVEKEACEKLYEIAKRDDADVVYIRPKLIFLNRIISDRRLFKEEEIKNKEIVFIKNLQRKIAWAPWSKMVKRELIIKNRIFFPEIHIAEDIIFSAKIIYHARIISECKDYLYNYHIRGNSLMSEKNPERKIDNYFESIRLMSIFLTEKNIINKYKKEFLYFKLYTYLAIYGVLFYAKKRLNKERIQKYKKRVNLDKEFRLLKIFGLNFFDSVVLASILIKIGIFGYCLKIRDSIRIYLKRWGKRINPD